MSSHRYQPPHVDVATQYICLMPRYYNIHTHLAAPGADSFELQNVCREFGNTPPAFYCSMGLHPWYLDDAAEAYKELLANASKPYVLAIGECGLDKLRGADHQLQEHYFRQQIKLATELNKPLIIHCVKAFEEVLAILYSEQVNVPVIFHGFRKNEQLATRILTSGYFLSFGVAIMKNAALQEVLATIPGDRFFLETDDAALSIEELYAKAAEIRKTPEDAIILQLQQNFKNIFRV